MTIPAILLLAALIGETAQAPTPLISVSFDRGHSARGIPLEVAGEGLAFVKGKIRDVDVWLLLDTASSSSILSKGIAQRSGLIPFGEEPESATGERPSTRTLRDVTIRLPGVELTQTSVSSYDLDRYQTSLGHKVDGVLGAGFFGSFVVELDYARALLAVSDPHAHRFSKAATAVPVRIEAGLPYVDATVTFSHRPPSTGFFLVDTGVDNAAILFSPFVDSHGLLGGAAKITPQPVLTPGAGNFDAVVRADELALSSFRFREPVVQLSRSTTGVLADSKHAGLLGGAVLSRFTVTFDFPHARVWLEKNRRYDELFLHDASGLSIVALGPDLSTFLIRRVSPSSPGSDAGFAAGDVIVAVDGKPAKDVGLRGLRRLLEIAGHKYVLTIFREGEIKKVTIECRRQL